MEHRIYREASVEDIPQLTEVRFSVKENQLSDPNIVTKEDYIEYLEKRGKGWVCEIDSRIVGFSIVDLIDHNIWALFVHPDFDKQGIGKYLHDIMLNWYFKEKSEKVWLGTSPGTRAEKFYRKAGWKEAGIHDGREIKFEMTKESWGKSNH